MAAILFIAFFVFLVLGIPVGFVLALSSTAAILQADYPLTVISQRFFASLDSFPYMAIPLFMLAGSIMAHGGITRRIIDFSLSLVGGIRGALAHVVATSGIMLGGISGSGVADAAALGSIMVPEMKRRNYDLGFSAALVAASGSIGLIIPPSIALIIYGVSTNTSIGDLFLAGIIPGVLIGLLFLIYSYFVARHAKKIVDVFGDIPFLTGGSGLMTELGRKYRAASAPANIVESGTHGKAIVLAGSCSVATLRQVEAFQAAGGVSIKADPIRLADGSQTKEQIWQQIEDSREEAVLVYSSDRPEQVRKAQETVGNAAHVLERTMAWLAQNAEKNGFNRIIVAGGETSGAVTQALGYNAYLIGQSIAPGVPIMVPVENQKLRLVLKSGNFGQDDFFLRAIAMTRGEPA